MLWPLGSKKCQEYCIGLTALLMSIKPISEQKNNCVEIERGFIIFCRWRFAKAEGYCRKCALYWQMRFKLASQAYKKKKIKFTPGSSVLSLNIKF